ncbi:Pentatricopeptide repeat-containing protein [Thalictrum thalictroides]|uniref:Pentatricopeptide repeat-containing protein n=1 Tax=Thalictrum thalictroides TaxID=46969 RepID=A0A7J6V0J8_THATH|nr:Pentatricopeptide repeat-containing protein [Thalictrum thalictroides]
MMVLEGVIADEFTFSSVFKGFADLGLLREGRKAHGRLVVYGLEVSNLFVGSALVDMYSKFGKMGDARLVFDCIGEKDVVLVTALIVGYTQHGEDGEALEVFRDVVIEGIKPNEYTFSSVLIACGNLADMCIGKQIHSLILKYGYDVAVASRTSLLTMYSKCGLVDDCLKVFDRFSYANLVTWTAVIMGLVQNGREESALLMFRQMIHCAISPNAFTLSTALRACSTLAMFVEGKQIHALIMKYGYNTDRFTVAALVDMYGKCGNTEMAISVFSGLELDKLDVVSVNSMIYSYAQGGYGIEAVRLYDQMQYFGFEPNDVTYVSVLSACSNAGLLDEGRRIFSSLKSNVKIEPSRDHYACMVDLLGRAGRLEEAETLITQVKNPDVVLWRTLLGACKIHGEVGVGERITSKILEIEPGDAGAHILLTNIYASTGHWNEVTKMKIIMKEMKLKKSPAMSWIEIDKNVHTFMAGDLSHPRAVEIDQELESLNEKIKVLGYLPDTSFVLQDLNEKEKERSLNYHSEKLTIAFGLLSNRNKTTCIRIFKNLRVCGDCHTWIKFVSKVVGREIIARDAKRFHQFKDGLCSCGDYW